VPAGEDRDVCALPRHWVVDSIGGIREPDSGVIEGIPFDVAIPMLAGWNLRYDFDDEHVQRIGVWLSDIEYDRLTPTYHPGADIKGLTRDRFAPEIAAQIRQLEET
jgi:hypothetical protein